MKNKEIMGNYTLSRDKLTLGETNYIKVNTFLTEEGNVEGDYSSLSFMAIVLKKNSFELYKYHENETSLI